MINMQNVDEYLFRSVENDLSPTEEKLLLQFLEKHPEFKPELNAYKQTIVTPPAEVTFKKKSTLYKPDKTYRITIMPLFLRVAAVLVLLLSVATAIYYFLPSKHTDKNEIAVVRPKQTDDVDNNTTIVQPESKSSVPIVVSTSKSQASKKNPKQNYSTQQSIEPNKTEANSSSKDYAFDNNVNIPVTNPVDTSLHIYQKDQTPLNQLIVNNQNHTQNKKQPEATIKRRLTPTKDKKTGIVSHWLRLNGNDKLANSIDFVSQLKDKEIEISYSSRYINFQKSISLRNP